MACGTPVAAFPVTGPTDVIEVGVTGYMNHDLVEAVNSSLALDRKKVAVSSMKWTWENCAIQFLKSLTIKNG
jgi:glycosyltransferase involved in cell wall biosynthesis